MLLEGLHLPLTTPFYPDGRLYLRKLEHNAERYSRTPAAGLAVLSESGEADRLNDAEVRQVLQVAAEASAAEKVLFAGIARDGVATTLGLVETAAALRFDAALIGQPRGVGQQRQDRSVKEQLGYFHAVADRSALPVVLVSGRAKDDAMLSTELILELAQHPRILGVVDAEAVAPRLDSLQAGASPRRQEVAVTHVFGAVTARMLTQAASEGGGTYIAAESLAGGGAALAVVPPRPAVRTRLKAVGFQVLAGSAEGLVEALRGGVVGAMVPFGACAPQACYEVLAAWKDGDAALATQKSERLRKAAYAVETQFGVAGIKLACDLNGYFGGAPRLPGLGLTGTERAEIEALMRALRN